MKINLKQLEAFVWVADLGSFRKAADRLNTTQPNVSSRIALLEGAMKRKLMERDAGSVRLTSKGIQMLDYARKVLQAAEKSTLHQKNPALQEPKPRENLNTVSFCILLYKKSFKEEEKLLWLQESKSKYAALRPPAEMAARWHFGLPITNQRSHVNSQLYESIIFCVDQEPPQTSINVFKSGLSTILDNKRIYCCDFLYVAGLFDISCMLK